MQTAIVTGNTALSGVAAIIGEIGAIGGGNNEVVSGFIPSTTGVAAAASVLYQLIRSDTGAAIGACTVINPGAGASGVGPAYLEAPVPPGFAGTIELVGTTSAGTASAQGSATAPVVLKSMP